MSYYFLAERKVGIYSVRRWGIALRIRFGSPPIHAPAEIEADAGVLIRRPGRWKSAILASLAGMILLSIPVAASIVYSVLFPESDASGSFRKEALPRAGMLISFALTIFPLAVFLIVGT